MSLTLHGTQPNVLASRVSMQWHEFQSKRTVNREKWQEVESYLYATDTTSLGVGDSYDHTTHIPITAEYKEELESIMYATVYPHADFLGWTPYDMESGTKEKRTKILAYIKNRHALNGFEKVLRKLIQDLVIYGNAFAHVYHDNSAEGYTGPRVLRISPYDIVFDPTASSFSKTTKIIRSTKTLGEFKEFAEKHDLDEEVTERILLRRGTNRSGSYIDTNKDKQYLPDGFTSLQSYYDSGIVELLWLYGDVYDDETGNLLRNQKIVVADRTELLLQEEEACHIHKASWAEKPDNLWSQGPLEKVIGMNYQINHRENSKSDALDRFIYPDRVYLGDVEEIYDDSTGQTKYLAPEGGGVTDLTPDTTVLTADMHQDRLLVQARTAAGLPPQLQGFRTAGEKTLGEVQSLFDAGMRKFIHKAAQFEVDLIEPVVKSELILAHENFTSMVQAATVGEFGLPVFMSITKDDLQANGVLTPIGSRRFARENQQLTMINTLANSNLGTMVAAHLNTYNLAQAVEELGGLRDYKAIEKFAAVDEQTELQEAQASAAQTVTSRASEPGIQEILQE